MKAAHLEVYKQLSFSKSHRPQPSTAIPTMLLLLISINLVRLIFLFLGKQGWRSGESARPGSIPGPGVVCGLSFLLVLVPARIRVFRRVLRFQFPHKNQHFYIPLRPGTVDEKLLRSFRNPSSKAHWRKIPSALATANSSAKSCGAHCFGVQRNCIYSCWGREKRPKSSFDLALDGRYNQLSRLDLDGSAQNLIQFQCLLICQVKHSSATIRAVIGIVHFRGHDSGLFSRPL